MLRNANTEARLLRSANPWWADGTHFLTSVCFRTGGDPPYLLEMLEELDEFKCMKCVNYKAVALMFAINAMYYHGKVIT